VCVVYECRDFVVGTSSAINKLKDFGDAPDQGFEIDPTCSSRIGTALNTRGSKVMENSENCYGGATEPCLPAGVDSEQGVLMNDAGSTTASWTNDSAPPVEQVTLGLTR